MEKCNNLESKPGPDAPWEEVVKYAEQRYAIKKGMCRLERTLMGRLKNSYLSKQRQLRNG